MEPCRPQVLTLTFITRDDGASSVSRMIQPRGVDEESSTPSAVTGWRPEAEVPERSASGDVGAARELECHTQCAARSHRARETGGERNVQDGRSLPAAVPAVSSVCRGCVATTKVPKCKLIQRFLPDQRRELRRHRCFNVGTRELRCSSHTELQRLRCYNDGHRGNCVPGWSDEQRASVEFPDARHVSSMGSMMTGSARAGSDAPVCASLEWLASAKSRPADKRKCS